MKTKTMKTVRINSWTELPNGFTGIAEFPNGSKHWHKKGKCHREDGPAKEWTYPFKGFDKWYLEDKSYPPISLKDYIVLDYYKGEYGIMR